MGYSGALLRHAGVHLVRIARFWMARVLQQLCRPGTLTFMGNGAYPRKTSRGWGPGGRRSRAGKQTGGCGTVHCARALGVAQALRWCREPRQVELRDLCAQRALKWQVPGLPGSGALLTIRRFRVLRIWGFRVLGLNAAGSSFLLGDCWFLGFRF